MPVSGLIYATRPAYMPQGLPICPVDVPIRPVAVVHSLRNNRQIAQKTSIFTSFLSIFANFSQFSLKKHQFSSIFPNFLQILLIFLQFFLNFLQHFEKS